MLVVDGLACCAHTAGHVLLTDIAAVAQSSLHSNIQLNDNRKNLGGDAAGTGSAGDGAAVDDGVEDSPETASWNASVPVGVHGGSAATGALDWTVPHTEQLTPNDPRTADMLMASRLKSGTPPSYRDSCSRTLMDT